MVLPPRTPPRFVPTLTEVVQTQEAVPGTPPAVGPLLATEIPPPATAHAHMSSASAVADVPAPPAPFYDDPAHNALPSSRQAAVLHAGLNPSPVDAPQTRAPWIVPVVARAMPEGAEEYMVHRVMQRVDVVLDHRLREAIATVVQEQTRSVLPRLREEIESVVRQAVYEAVADELASGAPPVSKG